MQKTVSVKVGQLNTAQIVFTEQVSGGRSTVLKETVDKEYCFNPLFLA